MFYAVPFAVAIALLMDRILGEPKKFHPLVGFGNYASFLEKKIRNGNPAHAVFNRTRGLLAWSLAVLPLTILAYWLCQVERFGFALEITLLYFAIGAQSLAEHGEAIAKPLLIGDLPNARIQIGRIVSRDTSQLDENGIARAAVESVLENGNDALFGTLFWFVVAGGAGAVMYRLANTLDAMWGYKTERFLYFGWAAARLDDILNFIPARLAAFTYSILGHTRKALACWRNQAHQWDSPNAGPVMAAGAGALSIKLGGTAIYHGKTEVRPTLGYGDSPKANDIRRAIMLMRKGALLWLVVITAISYIGATFHA
jgi:adenosylcobinamide-phosphate synthase